jgi:hypothetical protein
MEGVAARRADRAADYGASRQMACTTAALPRAGQEAPMTASVRMTREHMLRDMLEELDAVDDCLGDLEHECDLDFYPLRARIETVVEILEGELRIAIGLSP